MGIADRILSPDLVKDIGSRMLEQAGLMRWIGVLWALLGAFLTYQGYC